MLLKTAMDHQRLSAHLSYRKNDATLGLLTWNVNMDVRQYRVRISLWIPPIMRIL